MASSYPTSRGPGRASRPAGGGQTFEPGGPATRPTTPRHVPLAPSSDVLRDLMNRPYRAPTEFEKLLQGPGRPQRGKSRIPSGPRFRRPQLGRVFPHNMFPTIWPHQYPGHVTETCGLDYPPALIAGTFAMPCNTAGAVAFGFPEEFYPLGGTFGDLGFALWGLTAEQVAGLPVFRVVERYVWQAGEATAPLIGQVTPNPSDLPSRHPSLDPSKLPIAKHIEATLQNWRLRQAELPARDKAVARDPYALSERGYDKPKLQRKLERTLTRPRPVVVERPIVIWDPATSPKPSPATQTRAKPLKPETRFNEPGERVTEKKVGSRAIATALGVANIATESMDAIQALYLALPKSRRRLICDGGSGTERVGVFAMRRQFNRPNSARCRRANPAEQLDRIWRYRHELDAAKALENLLVQGLGDLAQFNVSRQDYISAGLRPHGRLPIGFEAGPAL